MPKNQKYLINTSNCRIPDIDPFNEEVIKYVVKQKYLRCTNLELLTYIDKSNGVATLSVNTSLLPLYSSFEIICCYSNISRINYLHKSDNDITLSTCKEFKDNTVISYPFIKVVCSNPFAEVYTNVHATAIPTENQKSGDRGNRFSVLLVGIDSISKLNLRRTMPKTYRYLEDNFINLKGYNKIGDNTFPNLMAILTGQNKAQLEKNCSTKVKLNNCDIIWDTFRTFGYVTAYAEDECNIGTFNYDRPVSFKNVPSFGLFWMNSYSHDDINIPSAMDEKVLEFLGDTRFKSSLNNTIMVFFSDHGFRFGDIRYTHTGWLEERLPFIYFHVPTSFQNSFPKKYRELLVNTQRLTTPYDIYNTLQEVLKLGNRTYKSKRSIGCPNCQSLFKEIDDLRTCKKAAVDQHWCTCTGHIYINPKDDLVILVAEFVVKEINSYVKSFTEGRSCSRYVLKKVITAGMSQSYQNELNETVHYFLVIIETKPDAMFEATVEANLKMGR
ncbi:hypothetical protein NQ314_016035, partial [Rhamnusium bicolor]